MRMSVSKTFYVFLVFANTKSLKINFQFHKVSLQLGKNCLIATPRFTLIYFIIGIYGKVNLVVISTSSHK